MTEYFKRARNQKLENKPKTKGLPKQITYKPKPRKLIENFVKKILLIETHESQLKSRHDQRSELRRFLKRLTPNDSAIYRNLINSHYDSVIAIEDALRRLDNPEIIKDRLQEKIDYVKSDNFYEDRANAMEKARNKNDRFYPNLQRGRYSNRQIIDVIAAFSFLATKKDIKVLESLVFFTRGAGQYPIRALGRLRSKKSSDKILRVLDLMRNWDIHEAAVDYDRVYYGLAVLTRFKDQRVIEYLDYFRNSPDQRVQAAIRNGRRVFELNN